MDFFWYNGSLVNPFLINNLIVGTVGNVSLYMSTVIVVLGWTVLVGGQDFENISNFCMTSYTVYLATLQALSFKSVFPKGKNTILQTHCGGNKWF